MRSNMIWTISNLQVKMILKSCEAFAWALELEDESFINMHTHIWTHTVTLGRAGPISFLQLFNARWPLCIHLHSSLPKCLLAAGEAWRKRGWQLCEPFSFCRWIFPYSSGLTNCPPFSLRGAQTEQGSGPAFNSPRTGRAGQRKAWETLHPAPYISTLLLLDH